MDVKIKKLSHFPKRFCIILKIIGILIRTDDVFYEGRA